MDVAFGPLGNLTVQNPGYTLKAAVSTGALAFDDAYAKITLYKPLQFHFHSPSEHTLNGK